MPFEQALREAMDRSGVNEEELAARLGVRFSTVYRWKCGSRVPSGLLWQALRDKLPYFADLIDGRVIA